MLKIILLNFLLLLTCNAKEFSDELAWENKELAANISDFTMGSMIVAPYLVAKKSQMPTIALIQSTNWFLTDLVKMRVKRVRPNGEDDRSFFSGHTSTAFTGAGLMCAMKKHCIEGLVVAGLTGYLRVAAKKHYLSDVIVGAGMGYGFGRYFPTVTVRF